MLRGIGTLARDEISAAVEEFLGMTPWGNYQAVRLPLLEFCLREMISPTVFGLVLHDRPEYVVPGELHIADIIAADSALIHVYRACALDRA